MIGLLVLAAVAALPSPSSAPSYGVGGHVALGKASLVGPDATAGRDGDALALGVAIAARLNGWFELRGELNLERQDAADLRVWSVAPAVVARGTVLTRGRGRLYLGAGAACVVRLDATVSDGESGRNDATDQIRKGDVAILGALGGEVADASARRWHAELRLAQGLFTIDPPPGVTARTRALVLQVGVTW